MERLRVFFHSYHPVVWALLLGTIIARSASFMALPFLAVYLSRTTEMSPILIGLTIGMGPLAGTIGSFIGGNLSDRFGRKVIMLSALFAWSGVFVGFGLSAHPMAFVLLNAVNGLCRSFFEPTSQALIADLTPREKRMKAFGMRYTAINIGATVGPLIGAYLGMISASLAFFITAGVYLVYAVSLLVLMSTVTIQNPSPSREAVTLRSALRVVKNDIPLRYFILGGVLVNLGYSQVESTLPQYLEGFIDNGVLLYSILLSTNAITVVILQIPISHWAEKRSLMRVMVVGSFLFSIGYMGFAIFQNWTGLIASMVILTLGEILLFPSGSIFIDQLAGEQLRGTYFGASGFRSLGFFLGSWIGGYILQGIGGSGLFWIISFVAASSSIFYYLGQRKFLDEQMTKNKAPKGLSLP
ncbi:MFS transporter [Microaerobacter geothermalis]|uniref:MDR family MFS transporter n=1 Tax=Microaerobacter geothermalis TaxID=674972 RepID=UPI001F1F8AEA|nr:MFS transporter [Microaerobacter geothermalis]MCF6093938.1 MFS transporter [Microaerobacter geothermalis]